MRELISTSKKKKKKKAQAGTEPSNIIPESSPARKKPPPPYSKETYQESTRVLSLWLTLWKREGLRIEILAAGHVVIILFESYALA